MMNISKLLFRSKIAPPTNLTLNLSRTFATTAETEEKIEIPKRVPRGPTDILRALESTVGRDPTAAHYKYHDDPFLIPLSSSSKRVFAMAQESGRKAAHWVRKQHSDLFQHKEADPMIEAFVPPMVYDEKSEVEVADLKKLIAMRQVSDAVLVYDLLKGNNVEIDKDIEQGLLELLCYQNCEDGVSEEFIEERWFKMANTGKEFLKKTWKDGDLAERIFNKMEPKTTQAYCAIIQGMTKYGQVDRAMQLFEESQKNNIVLNTNTFNSLIAVINVYKEDFNMRLSQLNDYLNLMKQSNLKPNLRTLNAILYTLSYIGNNKVAKEFTLKTLSEFKKLQIEPSLGSWYLVILTFCKERKHVSTILHDIVDLLENKDHQVRDIKDVNFFVTAMEMSRHHLNDVALARRIDKLLHFGNNYNLIGDSYKESVYFRHYFALLCANLPMAEFMNDVYFKLVPHIYVPELGIMTEVVNQIDANGAFEYIPRIWSDMIVFDQAYRENLVDAVLNVMINSILVSNEFNEKFANVAWDIYTRAANVEESRVIRLNLTGDLLGKILTLLARNKNFDQASTVMDTLDKNQQTIPGVPQIEALSLFVDLCIEKKAPNRAIACIQYCADCGFPEASTLALRLYEQLNLDEVFLSKLTNIVGDFKLARIKESESIVE